MKLLPIASLLTIGCVLVAAPSTSSQSPLLDALPADTLAIFSVDDLDGLKEKWAESTIGRLWADAALDAVRAEIDTLLDEADGEALDQTGASPAELMGMVHGPACLAMVAYTADPETEEFNGASALMLDTGDDLDVFSEGFDRFIDWAAEEGGLVVKTESYDDIDVAVLVDPEDESSECRYGFVGSVLLLTVEDVDLGRDVFGEIVDGLNGEGESVFSEDSPYRRSVAAESSADVRLWVDVGEIVRREWDSKGRSGQEEDDLDMEDMGLTLMGALGMAVDFAPGATEARVELEFTGIGWMQEILLAGIAGQQPSLAAWVPDGAITCSAMDFDLAGVFDAFLRVTMEQDPDEARDIIAGMAEMEEEIGFHPRDDLLDNMDGQMAFFSAEVPVEEGIPMVESAVPVSYALLVGLSDGEAMSATLDGVIRSQGLHAARQLQEFEGYTIYSVPFFPGMSAYYTVLDDLLVLSLSPTMLKDVLRRRGNADLPTLMTVEDVMRRNEVLPHERTLFGCQDAAAQMVGSLAALETMTMVFASMGIDLQQDIPGFVGLLDALVDVDPEVIEKYYRDTFSLNAVTLSEQGILMVSTGP